jgi:IstB-like ATP binding protein
MLIHPTVERLRALGLTAMADAFMELQNAPDAGELSREDWLGLLVDREATSRENKRLARRLREARLRHSALSKAVHGLTDEKCPFKQFQKHMLLKQISQSPPASPDFSYRVGFRGAVPRLRAFGRRDRGLADRQSLARALQRTGRMAVDLFLPVPADAELRASPLWPQPRRRRNHRPALQRARNSRQVHSGRSHLTFSSVTAAACNYAGRRRCRGGPVNVLAHRNSPWLDGPARSMSAVGSGSMTLQTHAAMSQLGRFEPSARGRGRPMISTGREWLHRVLCGPS